MGPQRLSQLPVARTCLTKARSIFVGDVVLAVVLLVGWLSNMWSLPAVLPYALGSACTNTYPAKLLGFLRADVSSCILIWDVSQVTGCGWSLDVQICLTTERE